MTVDFKIVDQGDGWWHCASPLACHIVDGPAQRSSGLYWLVEIEPAIVWNGDTAYVDRYGPDHALCQPHEPTNLALVMAAANGEPVDATDAWGIPITPVTGPAQTVQDAVEIQGLGIKARLTSP